LPLGEPDWLNWSGDKDDTLALVHASDVPELYLSSQSHTPFESEASQSHQFFS